MILHIPSPHTEAAWAILGALISTAIMTPLFLIVMAVVGILFVALQRFFSRSTIQLKRIEAVSRSPVYGHFGETLLGLATIRAFKHSERFRFTKVQRVDRMSHSFFILRCVLNWASLRVGTLNALLLAFAALFVVLAKGVLDPGSASLAVYFVLGIGPMLVNTHEQRRLSFLCIRDFWSALPQSWTTT